MKKSISCWQFVGFIFTSIAGVLLHFLYDLSNNNFIVGLFSAVNESIWEHMKLLFFPMFLFALVQSHYFDKEYKNFWCVKLLAIPLGVGIIPVIYYTYTGILGVTADWFNITIFFIAAAISYYFETKLLKRENSFCKFPIMALTILCVIGLIFVVLTFIPPQIPLFQDPITKTYGIKA